MKVLGRLLLVVALLFAQTSGVAHELWHASSLATHGDGDAKTPKSNPLCDFHTALSAVLGAVDGGSHAGLPDVQPAVAFADVDISVTGRSSLTPRSRGPPALL